jgi:hypothetical protein
MARDMVLPIMVRSSAIGAFEEKFFGRAEAAKKAS